MQTAVINIKTEPETKKKAQKVAKNLGFSLSSLIDGYLRHLIRTKEVHFSLEERPNAYLRSIMKQAKENYRKGNTSPAFKSAKDAIKYLEDHEI
ncbi:MAG: hypothetical protein AAB414_03500 [Patescibacteria group bacterium]